jgi:hypothetical protein
MIRVAPEYRPDDQGASGSLVTTKKGPGDEPGPKALGNGGVSSREDRWTVR